MQTNTRLCNILFVGKWEKTCCTVSIKTNADLEGIYSVTYGMKVFNHTKSNLESNTKTYRYSSKMRLVTYKLWYRLSFERRSITILANNSINCSIKDPKGRLC